jgi:hypothetical protein
MAARISSLSSPEATEDNLSIIVPALSRKPKAGT